MTKRGKVMTFLVTLLLCVTMLTLPVFAASTEQDGLEVSLTTDKAVYSKEGKIEATLTVTNTNETSVSNLILKNLVPDGYMLAEGYEAEKQVENLEPGETVTLSVTYVANATSNGDDVTDSDTENNGTIGNDNNTGVDGNDSSGNGLTGNNNKLSGDNVKTGDNSNIAGWIILLVASVVVIAALAVKKQKGKTILSLFLCLTMAGTIISMSGLQVKAAEKQMSITVKQEIKVDDDTMMLEGTVSYDVTNKDVVDTDNDGLSDVDEEAFGTDPIKPDTDGDGLNDYEEIVLGTDPLTPNDYDKKLDTDNDGLSDVDEEAFGTDPIKPDTDGDGLNDYEEIVLGTDPLTPNDYDKKLDSDSDGLTDIEEIEVYGTDPYNADTDDDGLSDYDEVNVYGTHPTKADTDEDTLSDGFEIEHDLDPNKVSTDGTTNDGKVDIDQTISDEGISLILRDQSNLAKPKISGTASGELSDNVFLSTSTDSALDDMRSVIGEAVYVDGNDEYINGLTLTFDVSSYEGSLENLTVVALNNDGLFDIVDSTLTGNELSCQLEKNGTYCVLNLEEFLGGLDLDLSSYWDGSMEPDVSTYSILPEENLSKDPNAIKHDVGSSEDDVNEAITDESGEEAEITEEVIEEPSADESYSVSLNSLSSEPDFYSAEVDKDLLVTLNETNKALLSSTVSGQADIVFAIDTTGSMSSTINNVVTNVTSFATTLLDNYNVNVNYALIDFRDLEEDGAGTTAVIKNESSNWFSNVDAFANKVSTLVASGGGDAPECSVDALETARRLDFRSSASKFIILITDDSYKVANDYGITSMAEEIELLKADNIITSVVTYSGYQSTYQSLYESTGGIYANISSSNFSSSLLELADLIGETTSDGTWVILKHGYRYVKLTDEADQDGDGLATIYELGDEVEIDLTPFIRVLLFSHGVPFENYIGKTTVKVYDVISDPTKADSDSDGIDDKKDTAPWKKGYADGSIGEMKLLAVTGDNISTVIATLGKNTGHSFLIYQSYVNDQFDLSSWNGGYITNSGSWVDAVAQKTPTSHYKINVNDAFAFSAGGDNTFDTSCAIYNMEFYKYFSPSFGFSYGNNRYFTEKVTQTQLEKMMAVMEKEAKKEYNICTHTCTHVSLNVWNAMYGTKINPFGMNTPRNLYYWMDKKGANHNFKLDTIIH